jgi:protease I
MMIFRGSPPVVERWRRAPAKPALAALVRRRIGNAKADYELRRFLMANELKGKKIAFLATDMVEQVELTGPWEALEDAGADLDLVSIKDGQIQGFNHYDKADKFKVDKTVEEASASDYDALVLPGGVGNPDTLRLDENAVHFVREFFEQGKPVGAICHAPWMLIEAGVVRDRTVTSWPSLRTDLRNAGANRVDQEVVVDNGLVTSRWPDDIPAFNKKLIEEFAEGRHEAQAAKARATS